MTLPELMDKLHTEQECYEHLERARWPKGVTCPRCATEKVWVVKRNLSRRNGNEYSRKVYECKECDYHFSATTGTIFHGSHLPLRTWFLAIHRISESKKGVSAKQLERELGVTYKTAWYLVHRIREALEQSRGAGLKGIIEADETYVKGQSIPPGEKIKRGRGSQRHAPVLGIKERGGEVRAKAVDKVNRANIMDLIRRNTRDVLAFHTDELNLYSPLSHIAPHLIVRHADGYVFGDVHVNSIESFWALLKRGIVGSYHKVSAKHLQRYVDEFCWRANHKHVDDPFGALLQEAATSPGITYAELTAQASETP